jgi:excisionase family DNA binding protein
MTMNTDELRTLVHARWQERLVSAFRERGWRPARHGASGGPVPWEEVASTAVEAIWSDVESIVSPIVELLAGSGTGDGPSERPKPVRQFPEALWLSADEVAPLLRTTAHTLRRFAREGRSPVPAHRIGARWWFARAEVERFLGTVEP